MSRFDFEELYSALTERYPLVEQRTVRDYSASFLIPIDTDGRENPVILDVFTGFNTQVTVIGSGITLNAVYYEDVSDSKILVNKIASLLRVVWI